MSRLMSVCGCGRDADLLAYRRIVPLSRYRSFAIAVRFALRCDAAGLILLKRFNASAEAGRSDLLVPFVAPHILIVSVILVIAGRSLVHELCSPW